MIIHLVESQWYLEEILSDFAYSAQRNMSTSSGSISLQRKLMEIYQVLAVRRIESSNYSGDK